MQKILQFGIDIVLHEMLVTNVIRKVLQEVEVETEVEAHQRQVAVVVVIMNRGVEVLVVERVVMALGLLVQEL